MFGSNYFGAPYFAQGWAGAVTTPTVAAVKALAAVAVTELAEAAAAITELADAAVRALELTSTTVGAT